MKTFGVLTFPKTKLNNLVGTINMSTTSSKFGVLGQHAKKAGNHWFRWFVDETTNE